MARTPTKPLRSPIPDSSPLLVVNFPTDLRRRVKSAAAMRGITMREFIVAALEDALLTQPPPVVVAEREHPCAS